MGNELTLNEALWIQLSDHTREIIGYESYDRLVARIETICGRFDGIINSEYAEFTVQEWCAICNALIGNMLWVDSYQSLAMELYDNVMDADEFGELGKKWEVDVKALASRLKDLSHAQTCSVLEVVNRFWQITDSGHWDSYQELLKAAGATIVPCRQPVSTVESISFGL